MTPADGLVLALLYVPAFAFLIHAYTRAVCGMDQLARSMQLEALVLAFPIAMLVAFTAGLALA